MVDFPLPILIGIIVSCYFLLRLTLSNHENLQTALEIIIAWGTLIGLVYFFTRQYWYPFTSSITLGTVAFSIAYWWYKRSTKPRIIVTISPRLTVPSTHEACQLVYLLTKRVPQVLHAFSIVAKVENGDIEQVGANIWINGDGPTYLLLRGIPAQKFMNFVSGQQENIPVCMAFKDDSGEYLWFHLDAELGPLDLKKMSAERKHVDLDIQFIGKEYSEKPRKFGLNIASWNELNLTFRD